MHRVKTIEGLP